MYRPELITKAAVSIMDTAHICKDRGAKKIFVGGVTVRDYEYGEERPVNLNRELKELCGLNGFIFIDNSNIGIEHLSDRVHLSTPGSTLLADNYLGASRKAYLGN